MVSRLYEFSDELSYCLAYESSKCKLRTCICETYPGILYIHIVDSAQEVLWNQMVTNLCSTDRSLKNRRI